MLKRFRVDPRDVNAADFPHDGTTREKLMFLLRFAILAPSVHNTQPWKFSIDRDRVGLFCDAARWLQVADPDRRDLHLSMGCVLENLLVAARHFGYAPEVKYARVATKPNFIATVDLSRFEPPKRRRDAALDRLSTRHTAFGATESRAVTPSMLEELDKACAGEGTTLYLTDDPAVRSGAGGLFGRATALQFADEEYRLELAGWIGRGEYGVPRVVARLGRFGVPQVEKDNVKEASRIAAAPYFGVILSENDDRISQVQAGQAMERVWLAAAGWNVSLRPASALFAVPTVKAELARLVGAGGLHVQQAFRLGYSEPRGKRSPRRKVAESIVAISLN